MKASHLPLNARVTIEIQDKDCNLYSVSIPGDVTPGAYFDETTITKACETALEHLNGTASVSHTSNLIKGRR